MYLSQRCLLHPRPIGSDNMHGFAAEVYSNFGSVSLAVNSYSTNMGGHSDIEVLAWLLLLILLLWLPSLVLDRVLVLLRCLSGWLLRRTTALISIGWAIPHHVVSKATFKAPTGDLVSLMGGVIFATMFTCTLS